MHLCTLEDMADDTENSWPVVRHSVVALWFGCAWFDLGYELIAER